MKADPELDARQLYEEQMALIAAAREQVALLGKIETIVQQWRRKMWSDAQAIGSIDAAIAKAHLKSKA